MSDPWGVPPPLFTLLKWPLEALELSQVADDLTMSQHLSFKELLTAQYVTWQAALTRGEHTVWVFFQTHPFVIKIATSHLKALQE